MQSYLQIELFLLFITIGRLTSVVTGIIGLISLFLGRQALVHAAGPAGSSRSKAIAALVVGLTTMFISILHLLISTGGFGTGSGKLGAIVAMLVGLTGTVLGAMALARMRQMAKRS